VPGRRRSFASLSRKQSEKDLTTDGTDRTDKRSEMPFIRVVSEISGCSFLRPGSWPDASQGAGRTMSGYDILPRIQGHAHAKPWAGHPASQVARFPAICAAGPRHFALTRSKSPFAIRGQTGRFTVRINPSRRPATRPRVRRSDRRRSAWAQKRPSTNCARRFRFLMQAWDQGTQLRCRLLRASILSLPRRGRPWNLGLTGMN